MTTTLTNALTANGSGRGQRADAADGGTGTVTGSQPLRAVLSQAPVPVPPPAPGALRPARHRVLVRWRCRGRRLQLAGIA